MNDSPIIGLAGVLMLLAALTAGIPIGVALGVVGVGGLILILGLEPALIKSGVILFDTLSSYELGVLPLFLLMAHICFKADASRDFFDAAARFFGHRRGGLALASIGGCAGFGTISGSSLATSATMGTVALPEMKKYKYDSALATGCIAAGGSIGILIPPSIAFIIYASLTEESIGKLFMAGVIPGIMEAVLYMLTIYVLCKINPRLGPPGPSSTWSDKFLSLKDTWGILVLFVLVIGGIYAGIFTPTEAAGVGAFGALILGFVKRKLTKEKILTSLADASRNTAMLLLMLIGADIFSYFLTMSQIPFLLSDFVVALPVPKAAMIGAILVVYVILGCIMPIIPAIVLTIPIFLPVVTGLGYNPIWFGVIVVTMAEMGQITPPVGINVFALAGVAKDVPLGTIFKGIFPFLVADVVRVLLIFFFPAFALWLPSLMG